MTRSTSGSLLYRTEADRRDAVVELRLRIEKARRLARANLDDYARHVFEVEPAAHHRLVIDALQGVYDGEIKRLVIIAPPGHAKSTYTSIIFPSWYLGHRPTESLIGISTTDPLAKLYGDAIATVFEQNPEFRAVFPDVSPDYKAGWSNDGRFLKGSRPRLAMAKDPQLVFVGAGGGIIGRRANGIIVDDPVDEATARSETLLEARKLWIQRSVRSRLKPKGWRIFVGTLWAEGDVVDTAMQSGTFVVIHMAAESTSTIVEADVTIPNGVRWRPGQKYRTLTSAELAIAER